MGKTTRQRTTGSNTSTQPCISSIEQLPRLCRHQENLDVKAEFAVGSKEGSAYNEQFKQHATHILHIATDWGKLTE